MPLSGLRVLDLSRFLPGPQAAALLGDYGAEVTRIEHPRHGAARDRAMGLDGLEGDARAKARETDLAGRGKRYLRLAFEEGAGRALFHDMVAGADVLIHDFRPRAAEALGLDAPALTALNPALVVAAISATGAEGPRAGAAGHDPVALALSGALARTGEAPHLLGFPCADLLTAAHAAFAILVALHRRRETGRGAVLDAAMSDSALALMTSVFGRQQRTGREPPLDFAVGDNAVFATADGGHVVATHMERPFWERFCTAVGRSDLAGRFADAEDRAGLMAALRGIFAARSRADWDALSRAHDLQIAPVLSPAEAMAEPHHHARGALIRTAMGTVLPGRPVRFADLPPAPPRPTCEPEVPDIRATG